MAAGNKPNPSFEYRVGLFTVTALIIFFWGWSWLKSFSLHPPQKFKVQFHDIAGLTKNAPVQVNGVRVGTVERIDLQGEGDVICSLTIPAENTVIPQGSTVTIQTLGLVGAKYVEISFPPIKEGEPIPPPIEEDTLLIGQDPVRAELYFNRIVTNFSNLSDCFGDKKASESLTSAVKDAGPAMNNIKDAAFKFKNSMDRLTDATTDIKQGAVSANGFFTQGKSTMEKFSDTAEEWRATGHSFNRLIDEPSFNSNVKETVQMARDTATKIQQAMHELNTTLADKEMRGDMITMLQKLNDSTENIDKSMQVVRQLADDKGLRSDLKDAMENAKEAMSKANELLSNPDLVTDARETMAELRAASAKVSKMAGTIDKLLSRKHPMLRLLFSSAFGSSEKTEVNTTTVKKTKKKEPVTKSDGAGPDIQEQTTTKEIEKTETNVTVNDQPAGTVPLPGQSESKPVEQIP